MRLTTIYPHNIEYIDFDETSIKINNTSFTIEKVGERCYKFIAGDKLYTFVHDDNFCAFGEYGNCIFEHHYHHLGLWVIPEKNILFAEVSKNACSTIISEIYNKYYSNEYNFKLSPDGIWVWDFLRQNPNIRKSMQISLDNFFYYNYKNRPNVFLIYDDPIKRFVRAINNKYTSQFSILSGLIPPYADNISDYISQTILLTKLNLMNKYCWDQHICPIAKYQEPILDYVTDFVYIGDSERYMQEKFNITPKRYYTSKQKVITLNSLNEKQILELKNIYKEDYQLPEKYKDKFYK